MVLFTSLILFIITIGLLYMLGANLRQLQAYDKKTNCYYFCETGASMGLLDFARGRIGAGGGQWVTRTFNMDVDGTSHQVTYAFTRHQGEWTITVSSEGCHLRVRGPRAFPIFIRGFGGM